MSGYITLHKEKGLNPRLSICRRCAKDVGVVLLGVHDTKFTCDTCGTVSFGSKHCIKCDGQKGRGPYHGRSGKAEPIGEHERIPIEICDECQKKDARLREVAQEAFKTGGILYRCKKCGSEGVIAGAAPLAKAVREKLKVEPPNGCGVECDGDCPVCQGIKPNEEA